MSAQRHNAPHVLSIFLLNNRRYKMQQNFTINTGSNLWNKNCEI